MNVVLICAIEEEAKGFLAMLDGREDRTVAGLLFSRGSAFGHDLTVVRCGVGKVNAAMCAQAVILTCAPDLVIHVGVAGGVGAGIATGHAVVASDTVQYDFDLSSIGEEKGKIVPCHAETARRLYRCTQAVLGENAHLGRIATGDRFVADGLTAAELRDAFGALACEMEGGAVAQVCAAAGVPCGILRAISDNANEHSAVDFSTFLQSAVRDTERIITAFLRGEGTRE